MALLAERDLPDRRGRERQVLGGRWINNLRSSAGRLLVILLLPVLLPAAAIAGLWEKPKQRTPQEVATLIAGFLDGTDEWAWDDFESVRIADPFLEDIRRRAVPLGPPNADVGGIRCLLAELKSRFPEVG